MANVTHIYGNEVTDAAARGSLAPEYSASSTYAVGDLVLHEGQLYECSTAISTAEEWTAAHWMAKTVADEVSDLKGGLTNIESDIGDMSNLETVAKSNLVAAINEAAQSGGGGGSSNIQVKESTKEGVDLDISDPNGNVILRLANGHIQTKNFDSAEGGGGGSDIIKNSSKTGVDLDISDPNGKVILRLKEGEISTKWFDSENVSGAGDYNADVAYSNASGTKSISANFRSGDTVVLHFVDANDRITDRIANVAVTYKYKDASNTEHTIASAYGYEYVEYTFTEDVVSVSATYGTGLLWGESGTLRFSVYKKGITERMPHIIKVASDGSGDYTSLRDAVDSITDNNAYNRYQIEVYSGTYEILSDYTAEEISATGFKGLFIGDGVSVVGIGQKDEIILHGTLNTTTYDSTKRNDISVINIAGNARLENLTISAENMRYCVHDDTASLTHQKAEKSIINCAFIAKTMTTRNIAYGCGISNRRKLHFKGCVFDQELHVHTHNDGTYSPEVIIEDCEGSIFSFADYDSNIDINYSLRDCKFSMIIAECSYAPHDQFLFVNQIGGNNPILDCESGQIYNLSNCISVSGQISAGYLVNVNRSSSVLGASVVTSEATANGVSLGYIGGNTIVASGGYINSNQVGLSSLTAGEYITVNSSGKLVSGGTSANAVGVVKGLSSRQNGGAYIKLFV